MQNNMLLLEACCSERLTSRFKIVLEIHDDYCSMHVSRVHAVEGNFLLSVKIPAGVAWSCIKGIYNYIFT
jgi:hypothetical protein